MTTQRHHRCGHCGDHYVYTASGSGCQDPYNHDKWCPSCTEVVVTALRTVPRKFEVRYRNIRELPEYDDVTLELVLSWEVQNLEEKRAAGLLSIVRIWPALYNLETGDNQSTRAVCQPGTSKMFRLSTWRQSPEYAIEVPMDYDLLNQRWVNEKSV